MGAAVSVEFGTLTLSKVVPRHTRTETFRWIKRDFMQFGAFKAARQRMGLGINDKCWWCKKPFEDADIMALAQPLKGANRVLCQPCAGTCSSTTKAEK